MKTMEEYGYLYTMKQDDTICLYRIFGTSPEIHIPCTINDKKVTEVSSYCFSKNNKNLENLLSFNITDSMYELCGDIIEEIHFPESIEKIGSFAFYNCKNLNTLYFSNPKEIGSDIFINCHNLHTIYLNIYSYEPYILKQILTQISWDIDIHFLDKTFFYPEYYEMYDEIGPAHIFGLNITGEGFRLRQCFNKNIILESEYDKTFEKLCVEENQSTCARFVMHRMMNNFEFYRKYIEENQIFISKYILMHTKPDESILKLTKMFEEHCLNKETISSLIESTKNIELITKLIEFKKTFNKKQMYDFEDFS